MSQQEFPNQEDPLPLFALPSPSLPNETTADVDPPVSDETAGSLSDAGSDAEEPASKAAGDPQVPARTDARAQAPAEISEGDRDSVPPNVPANEQACPGTPDPEEWITVAEVVLVFRSLGHQRDDSTIRRYRRKGLITSRRFQIGARKIDLINRQSVLDFIETVRAEDTATIEPAQAGPGAPNDDAVETSQDRHESSTPPVTNSEAAVIDVPFTALIQHPYVHRLEQEIERLERAAERQGEQMSDLTKSVADQSAFLRSGIQSQQIKNSEPSNQEPDSG